MVRPMVDNFSEYRFVTCGTTMATGDKQQPMPAKKMALRDLSNETRDTILMTPGNPPLQKERAPATDAIKVSTTLKQQNSCQGSPARLQPLGSNGINGHLVYVRRKIEADTGKVNNNNSESRKYEKESEHANNDDSYSPATKKFKNDCISETMQQVLEASVSPLPGSVEVPAASLSTSSTGCTAYHSNGKPIHGLPSPASECYRAPSRSPFHPEPKGPPAVVSVQPDIQTIPIRVPSQSGTQRPRDQHWKERFGHLQMFLKACDQSNQEEYIQRMLTALNLLMLILIHMLTSRIISDNMLELRSLSSSGRSRHAYELERKAIQLTLEEGNSGCLAPLILQIYYLSLHVTFLFSIF